jgi:hypothetical protein
MAKVKTAKAPKGKGKTDKAAASKPIERHALDFRDADMPPNINFRRQKHGDEPIPATDIRLSGIEISKDETNALLQERYASRALWAAGGKGKAERPVFEYIEPIKLRDTIESARVSIKVGSTEVKLGVCKLKNVTVAPQLGGVAKMDCTVQATPTIDDRIIELIQRMDGKVRVKIEYEHNAEQLEAFEGDEAKKAGDPELKQFEDSAKAQIDGFNRGTPVGDSPAADTH